MSPSLPSQTYTCQCAGCASGGSFEAAPESWWHEKGLTAPRNCPSCREWIKEQSDELVPCSSCRWDIPVSAKRKISFHKREGHWSPHLKCARCAADPVWAQQAAAARLATRVVAKAAKVSRRRLHLVETLKARNAYPTALDSFPISNNVEWWKSEIKNYAVKGDDGRLTNERRPHSAYEHVIGQHATQLANNIGRSTDNAIVTYLSELAASTDSEHIVQFRQNQGSVVKLDTMTNVAIILDIRDPMAPSPITSFPPNNGKVERNLTNGRWKP